MLVFIDDSGDPGFKIEKGSSIYFIIAMVVFADELEAEKTAIAIKELKRKIGFSDNTEFRFFKTNPKFRKEFFKTINSFDFIVRALVVDKRLIYSQELKSNKNSFYAYFIKEVLKKSSVLVKDAKIKIDGSGDRIFKKQFMTYLRRELNSSQRVIMKNCKMIDSKKNVLIQMADMVAGSVNRSESGKSDAKVYVDIIHKHIEDIWCFK
jgi:hypothetical protein